MVCVMVGSYYGVVLGWVMKYVVLFATGFLGEVASGGVELTTQTWNDFAMVVPAWEAVGWFAAGLIVAAIIIARGIQGSIETANKIMIPAVFILLAILVVRVLMIPKAVDGLEYTSRWRTSSNLVSG